MSYFISRSIHVPLLRARDSLGAALATWRLPVRMAVSRCIGSMLVVGTASSRRLETKLARPPRAMGGDIRGRGSLRGVCWLHVGSRITTIQYEYTSRAGRVRTLQFR